MSATSINSAGVSNTTSIFLTSNRPLTDDEARKKAIETQQQNVNTLEKSLNDNSAGWGKDVTIRVPADKNGKPIQNPTEQDWINAAKNGTFVETTGKPASLAQTYFNIALVDLGDASLNAKVNAALLGEFSAAVANGKILPTQADIQRTAEGDLARAIIARQKASDEVKGNIGIYYGGQVAPRTPADSITIRVPADASGKPIQNPTMQDWLDAEKNNRYVEVKGNPFELSKTYLGVELNREWMKYSSQNQQALNDGDKTAKKQAIEFYEFNKGVEAGLFMDTRALTDIDPQVLQDAMAIFGDNYKSAMGQADEDSKKMENLRKKYDALKNLENSISSNNTAGDNSVDFNVPTKVYELDANGNRIPTGAKDENGNSIYKTKDVSNPPSNEDWANAAEFKSIKELNGGKDINGRDAAKKYFNIELSNTSGDNAHTTNLSNNLTKISNERGLVDAEMKKISGKFDFNMGNAQTILSMTNKMMSSLNDSATSIIRGI